MAFSNKSDILGLGLEKGVFQAGAASSTNLDPAAGNVSVAGQGVSGLAPDTNMGKPDSTSMYAMDSNVDLKKANLAGVYALVNQRFKFAETARRVNEDIWIACYYQHRGEYSPAERQKIAKLQERNPNASEAYVKITKAKNVAAIGQIREIIWGDDEFPVTIQPQEATPVEGATDEAFITPEAAPDVTADQAIGYQGDGKQLPAGATRQSLLGGLQQKFQSLLSGQKVQQGPNPDPKQYPELQPNKIIAQNLEDLIKDQLEEGDAERVLNTALLEMVIFGTGVVKGPFTIEETIHKWDKDPDTGAITYNPEKKLSPKTEWASVWNLYPDPNARNIHEASYVIERHLMSEFMVKRLKKMSHFDKNAIERLIQKGPRHERKFWENIIRDQTLATIDDRRYEVFEYWGYLDKEMIRGLDLADETTFNKLPDEVQVNVWIAEGEILRVTLNPFTPQRIPYYIIPYEEHPYQIWGIGLSENVKDAQDLMNGHWRMAIDNLRFAGNCIFEVNEGQLVPGQDMTLYPGKIFRKQGGAPGQSVYGITIPNTSQSHVQLYDKARQIADDVAGQPSYSYGQSGIQGTSRTAAGMSMLMSAANLNIKTVIKNIDFFLIEPLARAFFYWNMQFNEDRPEIRGDIKIVAKGTQSLMQKEVQSQRLLSLLQVASNPNVAPFVKFDGILNDLVRSLGLKAKDLVNDPVIAKLYAQIIGAANGNQNGQAAGPQAGSPAQPGSAASAQSSGGSTGTPDNSGGQGGNIGVGTAPQSGEAGHSAPTQGT
jgi:hypothetical protein